MWAVFLIKLGGIGARYRRIMFDMRLGGGLLGFNLALSFGVLSVIKDRFRLSHGTQLRTGSSPWFGLYGAYLDPAVFWVRVSDRSWLIFHPFTVGCGKGYYFFTIEWRFEL